MTPFEPSRAPLPTELWKHGSIPVIGLTGAIAGGKSEVARILAERGYTVLDADRIGHELLEDDAVRGQIFTRFGTGVGTGADFPEGATPRIDRQALAAIVFADPAARRALEAILHPRMRARFLAAIQRELQAGRAAAKAVVIDAAILLEAGWNDLCDRVVWVDAPRPDRIRRAARDRGWSQETFLSREQAQWSCEEKRRCADLVIENDTGFDSLRREVDRLDAMLAARPAPALQSALPVGAQATTPALPFPGKTIPDSSLTTRGGNLA
jgi:dephospho-CoA kinase